jgi:acyl-CoA thioester hydrolase
MTPSHEARVRVRYAETDQMGVVYYANYIVWMEVGRVELFRSLGFNYSDMERDDGVLFAVLEVHCRYRFPARYDEEVLIKTWVKSANTRTVSFAYAMSHAGTGRLLAEGETRHIFLGRDMRPTRLPKKYHAAFGLTDGE